MCDTRSCSKLAQKNAQMDIMKTSVYYWTGRKWSLIPYHPDLDLISRLFERPRCRLCLLRCHGGSNATTNCYIHELQQWEPKLICNCQQPDIKPPALAGEAICISNWLLICL